MMMPCWEHDGALINIGPWDDKGGENPLPEGAVAVDRDIVEGWDGGLYAADDPRRLGPGG